MGGEWLATYYTSVPFRILKTKPTNWQKGKIQIIKHMIFKCPLWEMGFCFIFISLSSDYPVMGLCCDFLLFFFKVVMVVFSTSFPTMPLLEGWKGPCPSNIGLSLSLLSGQVEYLNITIKTTLAFWLATLSFEHTLLKHTLPPPGSAEATDLKQRSYIKIWWEKVNGSHFISEKPFQ